VDNEAARLSVRWRRLVGHGAPAVAAESVLIAQWRQPHRAYHTTTHLAAVLDRLDELAGDGADVSPAVRLAAWLHDAVYDPRRSDNEARSAELATALLTPLALDPTILGEVVRLVQLTVGHRPAPGDVAGGALCDADLAVLASSPDAYRDYAAAVRREYRHLPDAVFVQGRIVVVADLLGRPQLYATPAGRRRWEAAARANLAGELATLEAALG
jgi:predicted metal-dependent HD superfamily phosphohydrolase